MLLYSEVGCVMTVSVLQRRIYNYTVAKERREPDEWWSRGRMLQMRILRAEQL